MIGFYSAFAGVFLSLATSSIQPFPVEVRNFSLPNATLSVKTKPIDPTPLGEFKRLAIPLKRAGNLILIDAKIDNIEGSLIFDTGASTLVLNQTYFRKVWPADDLASASGVNGMLEGPVMRTNISRFSISELYYENLRADVAPLGHLENSREVKILGLIGASIFSRLQVELDLANEIMYLTRLDNEGNPIQSGTIEGLPDFELPLRYSNQHMVIETEIGGKKLPFLLDTGAEMTILDSRLPGKCMEVFVPRGRSKLVGSDGKKKEVITGALKAIKMGGVELKFIPAMVADLGQAFDLPISGIIGYDLLSRGIAVINTRKGLFSMYLYNRN